MSAWTAVIKKNALDKSLVSGIIAGLGGGVVFGMMMAMMGMLPMVAGLVGSQSAAVGAVVHMAISAAIGAFYGLAVALGRFQHGWGFGALLGMVNGVVWWVLGALVLMPLGLGMNQMVFVIGQAQWMSLIGHLVYGITAGLLFEWLSRRK